MGALHFMDYPFEPANRKRREWLRFFCFLSEGGRSSGGKSKAKLILSTGAAAGKQIYPVFLKFIIFPVAGLEGS
jgi:hypothetical protein